MKLPHIHSWIVFSTALTTCELILLCEHCDKTGTVKNPTKKEWKKAFTAPSQPYKYWKNWRVTGDEILQGVEENTHIFFTLIKKGQSQKYSISGATAA